MTNTTCDEEGKCICWIPDTGDDGSCHETKCNAEEKDGFCISKYQIHQILVQSSMSVCPYPVLKAHLGFSLPKKLTIVIYLCCDVTHRPCEHCWMKP